MYKDKRKKKQNDIQLISITEDQNKMLPSFSPGADMQFLQLN